MKVLVPVKRVVDANARIRVKPDGSGVDTDNVKMSMNPFDEIAVEAAVRLREAGLAEEVVVVTVGGPAASDVLRTGLAMGADRALLVEAEVAPEPLGVARALKAVVGREGAELVVLGKQAIDDDANQTGQMLAGLLNWAQGAFASAIDLGDDTVTVTREVDGGLETVALDLPCVVTADLRLNEPRYATLPNIMKAKRKPLETIPLGSLDADAAPRLTVLGVEAPPQRPGGVTVADVDDLVARLKADEVLA